MERGGTVHCQCRLCCHEGLTGRNGWTSLRREEREKTAVLPVIETPLFRDHLHPWKISGLRSPLLATPRTARPVLHSGQPPAVERETTRRTTPPLRSALTWGGLQRDRLRTSPDGSAYSREPLHALRAVGDGRGRIAGVARIVLELGPCCGAVQAPAIHDDGVQNSSGRHIERPGSALHRRFRTAPGAIQRHGGTARCSS
jgi:hypothetical protein